MDVLKLKPKTKAILKWLSMVVLLNVLIFIFFTRLIKYIAPFIVAFVIMISIENLVGFIEKRLKLSRSISVAIALTIFVIVVGGILFLVFYKLIVELWKIAAEIPKLDFNFIVNYFESLVESGQDLFFSLPKSLADTIEESVKLDPDRLAKISMELSIWLRDVVVGTIEFLKSLPQVIVFVIVTMISAYFMSKDRSNISTFVTKNISTQWLIKIRRLKENILMALTGFIRARAILMLITFLELLIGFWILRVKYVFFFSIFTTIVDVLPVIGTGTILVPTSLIFFIMGNAPRGIGFLTLYFIIFIIRQIIEPKVLSQSLDLHPLVTLISMYVGLKLMGIKGMILGPIVIIVIKAVYKAELFPVWDS